MNDMIREMHHVEANRWVFLILAVFLASELIASVSHAQENSITPNDAAKHMREVQTLCGMVVSTKFASQSKRQPTFIILESLFHNQRFITIVIWGSDRSKFPEPPEDYYQGKKICVKGMIKEYLGKPEVIVNDPSQITIVSSQ